MSELVSWEARFGARTILEHAARSSSSTGDTTLPRPGVALDVVAVARVNHGRWIADCPSEGCGGAEYVNLEEPFFFCCECRNDHVDYALVKVEVPKPSVRAQLEAYLVARPRRMDRNWHEGETVADLRAENRERDIKLRKTG